MQCCPFNPGVYFCLEVDVQFFVRSVDLVVFDPREERFTGEEDVEDGAKGEDVAGGLEVDGLR